MPYNDVSSYNPDHRAAQRLVVLAGAWLAVGVIGLWDSYPWGLPPGLISRAFVENDEQASANANDILAT